MSLERGAESGVSINASKIKLLCWDLVDAGLVTATVKLLVEPCVSNLDYRLEWDESGWHHKYVGVVVLLDELSDFGAPAESGAYALMLVERHLHAVACAAECDSEIHAAAFYG